eukprot:TRINITY_DN28576_c0_g1_i1.p1 TRINITY_DN28576_c0_g1~~TRINITY_DN28576_c0_g1_i1.p1  ORF type:complete len:483 (+),score=68.90 TRINITY_DN28576_c0_g1_i1:206-1450(+)
MAALTLGVACLFSIAWINPTEKKKETKKLHKQEILSVQFVSNNDSKHLICTDTTKKRKIKIVTIDANGNKTEYNSVKEMPDSIRKDFYREELFGNKGVYRINLDSSFKFKFNDSLLHAKLYKEYNSPEAQAKWRKFGEDVAKQYNSPEAQAKWRKFGEDVAKQYNSPEAQAKWKKMGEDMAKQYNSPEAQAKWKKFGEDIAKQYNSPEAQAKWKKMAEEMSKKMNSPEAQAKWRKMGEEMAARFNTPEFRAQIDNIRMQALKSGDMVNLSGLTRLNSDSLFKGNRNMLTGPDGAVFYYNDNNNSNSKVRQTEEYKKLKEKFDIEVKELQEKLEKKEKNKKVEGGNKGTYVSPAIMIYDNKNFTSPAKALNIENAVVTYKKADFKNADQLAVKSFVKAESPIAVANSNSISIAIK